MLFAPRNLQACKYQRDYAAYLTLEVSLREIPRFARNDRSCNRKKTELHERLTHSPSLLSFRCISSAIQRLRARREGMPRPAFTSASANSPVLL